MEGVEGEYMFKTRVLAQWTFLYMYLFICNLENYEKIAFMKIKKKVSCGSQMPCALGPEPPNFFYLALPITIFDRFMDIKTLQLHILNQNSAYHTDNSIN